MFVLPNFKIIKQISDLYLITYLFLNNYDPKFIGRCDYDPETCDYDPETCDYDPETFDYDPERKK